MRRLGISHHALGARPPCLPLRPRLPHQGWMGLLAVPKAWTWFRVQFGVEVRVGLVECLHQQHTGVERACLVDLPTGAEELERKFLLYV